MPRIVFTSHLQRHLTCPAVDVAGETVREVLDAVFAENKLARGYVLDDQSALRKHVIVFVNGERVRDRVGLTDAVPRDGQVYVLQALSGG